MLPRRPERHTGPVFTLGDTVFTLERSFSFFCGWRGSSCQTDEWSSSLVLLCLWAAFGENKEFDI